MSATLTYEYKAVDRAGAERTGLVTAGTPQEAFRKVAAAGATPVRLRPVREKRDFLAVFRGVSSKDVAQVAYQMSALLEARIPIADGIRGIGEQETNPRLREALLDIAAKVQAGAGVTAAMSAHRQIFGDVFVETMRAAERSGNMIKALSHLAEMLERHSEGRRQVKQAMTYPLVALTALGGATIFLLVFVVPKFAAMFAARGVTLPGLTRALQAFGVSIREYWWVYAVCAGFAAWGLRRTWRSARGRAALDRMFHRIPYLRRVLVGLAVGRFARALGLTLGSGLGLIESIETSGRATGRPLLMEDTQKMIEQVRQGGRLSDVLRTCRYLPLFSRRMLAAGEESAELTRMCDIVARHYEGETSRLIKGAATVIEPLLIALLTGVVLVIALAIFLPMWDMVGLVR